jgi:hypothetical protein
MDPEVDLLADLNAEDDDGLGWSTLSDARDPSLVHPGAMLAAGNSQAKAVARVVTVDEDGQVHFRVLPGSLDRKEPPSHRPRAGLGAETAGRVSNDLF